jgi:protein tyrosine phosphatase (PTP) superfamily phosphohydrolase (DUF442 family)
MDQGKMNPRISLAVLIVFGLLLNGLADSTNTSKSIKSRPANWAVPVVRSGLPNCFQLTTNFYRGAQPSKNGMAALNAMGIKTVVNLRTFHSDDGKLAGTGLQASRLKLQPWKMSDEEAIHFLRIAGDTNNLPMFVHCQRGADRTGTICALYRMAYCGWTKDEAIREMKEGGFGFNPTWQNLVKYLEHADIKDLKRRARSSK